MDFRLANSSDLAELNTLEQQLFAGDRISPRQMKRFLQSSQAMLFVADSGKGLAGYALLLFHQGTQLSRLYSIAVKPDFRGRGIAQSLLGQCERAALDQGVNTLRLEVREDNTSAINFYQKMGYQLLKFLVHYYDDLCDGRRMQKRLSPQGPRVQLPMPLYIQTTPFTCGAACLLMSFSCLSGHEPSRTEELQLWREATTIFMAAGHGGCSAQGLALAALRRGYSIELWTQSRSTPFIDSVRDKNKKAVITLVHNDFCQQLASQHITVHNASPTIIQLKQWIDQGCVVLLMISTYRFNGKKEPHWIILSGMNENFFFIHDPFADSKIEVASSAYIPVGKAALSQIIGFGKQKHTACVIISQRD